MADTKKRAPRNRTLTVTESEKEQLLSAIVCPKDYDVDISIVNKIVNDDFKNALQFVDDGSISLLILEG